MATKKIAKPSKASSASTAATTKTTTKTTKTTKRVRRKTAPKITKRSVLALPKVCTQETVAVAAYFRAEQRGFAPGHELEDWLIAEQSLTN